MTAALIEGVVRTVAILCLGGLLTPLALWAAARADRSEW